MLLPISLFGVHTGYFVILRKRYPNADHPCFTDVAMDSPFSFQSTVNPASLQSSRPQGEQYQHSLASEGSTATPQQLQEEVISKADRIRPSMEHKGKLKSPEQCSGPIDHARLAARTEMSISATEPLVDLRSVQSEKGSNYTLPSRPEQAHVGSQGSGRDPEKLGYETFNNFSSMSSASPLSSPGHPQAVRYVRDNISNSQNGCSEHLTKTVVRFLSIYYKSPLNRPIQLYLSFPNPIVAFVLCAYALAAAILFTVLLPFSMCLKKESFERSLITAILPAIRFQLRRIDYLASDEIFPLRASRLALVALLSPFYAIGIALAAWVAAIFWLYATILGEPNERGGKEKEGKEAIRGVRRWWENWLLLSMH